MSKRNPKRGTFLIVTGLLLVAAAFVLTAYNLWTEKTAGDSADAVLSAMLPDVEAQAYDAGTESRWVFVPYDDQENSISDQTGRWIFVPGPALTSAYDGEDGKWVFIPYGNTREMSEAGDETGRWMFLPLELIEQAEGGELQILMPEAQPAEYPDYLLNPNMDMPQMKIDGNKYIGMLQIPALKLALPVMGEWSYPKLRTAPCRYTGSVYTNDLIICGHNYDRHFGRLKTLKTGSEVDFTDAAGNVFRYKVVEIEILKPHAVNQMKSGDWDLTLFTCTIGGRTRVTVRCERI